MSTPLKELKYQAHLSAVKQHQTLLESLHLNGNQHLDEVNASLEQLTITLEEYLKLLGIP